MYRGRLVGCKSQVATRQMLTFLASGGSRARFRSRKPRFSQKHKIEAKARRGLHMQITEPELEPGLARVSRSMVWQMFRLATDSELESVNGVLVQFVTVFSNYPDGTKRDKVVAPADHCLAVSNPLGRLVATSHAWGLWDVSGMPSSQRVGTAGRPRLIDASLRCRKQHPDQEPFRPLVFLKEIESKSIAPRMLRWCTQMRRGEKAPKTAEQIKIYYLQQNENSFGCRRSEWKMQLKCHGSYGTFAVQKNHRSLRKVFFSYCNSC